jgi:hypothetical protein
MIDGYEKIEWYKYYKYKKPSREDIKNYILGRNRCLNYSTPDDLCGHAYRKWYIELLRTLIQFQLSIVYKRNDTSHERRFKIKK